MKKWIVGQLNKFKWRNSVIFDKGSRIDKNTIFEGNNRMSCNSEVSRCFVGRGTYIGEKSIIKDAIIGKFTCIGPNVANISGSHPTSEFVSIHPAFYSVKKQAGFTFVNENRYKEYKYVKENEKKSIIIGNDCWIGYGVKILEGIKIGDGVIVAAGAIVTHNLEDYGIYAGIPAKLIRKRFEDDQIKELKKIKWWNNDDIWLKKHSSEFTDIEEFISKNKKT